MKRAPNRVSIVSQTVAKTYSYVIGVDTHAKKHVYAIVISTGEHVETRDFPTTSEGIKLAAVPAGTQPPSGSFKGPLPTGRSSPAC